MAVDLPAEFDQFVKQELASGHYKSQEEVVCDALRVFRHFQQMREDLKSRVEEGTRQIESGEAIELDDEGLREFFDDIQTRGAERYRAKQS